MVYLFNTIKDIMNNWCLRFLLTPFTHSDCVHAILINSFANGGNQANMHQ